MRQLAGLISSPPPVATDTRTTSWVINAITRLVAQIGYLPEYVHTQIALHLTATDTEIQQVYIHKCMLCTYDNILRLGKVNFLVDWIMNVS